MGQLFTTKRDSFGRDLTADSTKLANGDWLKRRCGTGRQGTWANSLFGGSNLRLVSRAPTTQKRYRFIQELQQQLAELQLMNTAEPLPVADSRPPAYMANSQHRTHGAGLISETGYWMPLLVAQLLRTWRNTQRKPLTQEGLY